jgi:hypothetical protein
MLDCKIRETLLVDELQLGDTLNVAVSENNRAYFDLLLSMVSNDVTDDAQYSDLKKERKSNEELRRFFNLQEREDSLYCDTLDFQRAEIIGSLASEQAYSALNLTLAMNKEPLALNPDERLNEILENVSPLTRVKNQILNNGEKLEHIPYDLTSLAIVEAIDRARDLAV